MKNTPTTKWLTSKQIQEIKKIKLHSETISDFMDTAITNEILRRTNHSPNGHREGRLAIGRRKKP